MPVWFDMEGCAMVIYDDPLGTKESALHIENLTLDLQVGEIYRVA